MADVNQIRIMSFEFTGSKAMERKIAAIQRKLTLDVDQAITIEAEAIAFVAKRDHVPVDLGTLRSSIHVGELVRKFRNVVITILAGGAAAPYALAVHNHPSDASPPTWQGKVIKFSPSGRGPQYLGIPLRNAVRGMAGRIARRIGL